MSVTFPLDENERPTLPPWLSAFWRGAKRALGFSAVILAGCLCSGCVGAGLTKRVDRLESEMRELRAQMGVRLDELEKKCLEGKGYVQGPEGPIILLDTLIAELR